MKKNVCYFGDDAIGGAASYLSGVMSHYGITYDRVDSGFAPGPSFFDTDYDLYVLSDYPRTAIDGTPVLEHIVRAVTEKGSGLLMIGGWESFHGRLGEYHNTPIAPILPVIMEKKDDRRNYPVSLLMHPCAEHPITDGLPWETPPGIGGFNAFKVKKDATLLIEGLRFNITLRDDSDPPPSSLHFTSLRIPTPLSPILSLSLAETVPLLAVGCAGNGRTAAFASDAAPHWVGGFVDWGIKRIYQKIGEGFIEVGEDYALFWRNLIRWTARLDGGER